MSRIGKWSRLAHVMERKEPLGTWGHLLGTGFSGFRPYLVKCVGEYARSIVCPETGHSLEVRQVREQRVAYPDYEYEADADEIREVADDDVQLWRLCPERLGAAFREACNLSVAGEWADGRCILLGGCRRSDGLRRVHLSWASDSREALEDADRIASRDEGAACVFFVKHFPRAEGYLQRHNIGALSLEQHGGVNAEGLRVDCVAACRTMRMGQERTPCVAARRGYVLEVRGHKPVRVGGQTVTIQTWRCHCEGRVFDLPDITGSALLVGLLREPGRTFYADAMMRRLTGEAVDVANEGELEWLDRRRDEKDDPDLVGSKRRQVAAREEVWDAAAIARHMGAMRGLREQIAECGDGPATAGERGALEQQLEECLTALKKNTRPGAGGMPMPKTFDNDLTKAANLVGKHFRGLLKRLKVDDEGLWQHLSDREILRYGRTSQYSAEKGYRWQVD